MPSLLLDWLALAGFHCCGGGDDTAQVVVSGGNEQLSEKLPCAMIVDEVENSWRSTFDFFDLDRSGHITHNELRECLQALGQQITDKEVQEFMRECGGDSNGGLDYGQFVLYMQSDRMREITVDTLRNFFNIMDKDGSGYVTTAELRHCMTPVGQGLTDDEMDWVMHSNDEDGNGQITFPEFQEMVEGLGFNVSKTLPRTATCLAEAKVPRPKSKPKPKPSGDKMDLKDKRVLEALRPLCREDGKVNLADVKEAVELLQGRRRGYKDPEDDPSLHWEKGRKKKGLGEVLHKANHIAIIVSDVGRSARFYSEVLGLQQIRRPDFDRHGAWFTMGNLELHLIKGVPVVHTGDDLIVGHISLETEDISRVPAILKRLGVPFRQNVSVPKGQREMGSGTNDDNVGENIVVQYFLRDPDGYYLEICNCDVLTKYCLGELEEFGGYDSGVGLETGQAAVFVDISLKLAQQARTLSRQANVLAQEMAGQPFEKIAQRLGFQARATDVDEDKLARLLVRQTIYGDLVQGFSEAEIRLVMQLADNSIPKAMRLMQIKAGRESIMKPPAFYEQGEEKYTPQPIHMTKKEPSALPVDEATLAAA